MDRVALIIVLAILAQGSSCQTTQQRVSTATAVVAVAKAKADLPDLPASCTVKTGRVVPKQGEPWVISNQRWNVVADQRDRKSSDCAAEWAAYQNSINGVAK